MIRSLLITSAFLLTIQILCAQNVGINNDGSLPEASALLDIKSSDKGILIPRMSTSQREAIINPAESLIVFDSTESRFYFYKNNTWEFLADQSLTIQDLETSPDSIRLSNSSVTKHLNEVNHWDKISDTLESIDNIIKIEHSSSDLALLLDDNKTSIHHGYNFLKTKRQWLNFFLDSDDNQGNARFNIYNDGGQDTMNAMVSLNFDGGDSWISSTELGIGTSTPSQRLEVNGAIRIKEADLTNLKAGTMRFNNTTNDFEGWNGTEWLSLTSCNPGYEDPLNKSPVGDLMCCETQRTSNNSDVKCYGNKVFLVGDYAFVRLELISNSRKKIQVLKNQNGQWINDTLLANPIFGGSEFFWGNVMAGDSERLLSYSSNNGIEEIVIYKADSLGVHLEQILPFEGGGFTIQGERIISVNFDSTYIYELNNQGIWTHIHSFDESGNVSLFGNRFVRHNNATNDLEFWHKVGNVWGIVQTEVFQTGTGSQSMDNNFFAALSSTPGNHVIMYEYANGMYSIKSLPSQATNHNWNRIKILGDYMILSDYTHDFQGTSTADGIARVFKYDGSNWVFQKIITDTFFDTSIGHSISTDGVNYIIGAPVADVNGVVNGGKVLLGPID